MDLSVPTILRQIARQGPPAQAELAAGLLESLADRPRDDSLRDTAAALADAYLHDPHLTR